MTRKSIFLGIVLIFLLFVLRIIVFADSIEEQIAKNQSDLNVLEIEFNNKKASQGELNKKLQDIKSNLDILEQEIERKAQEVKQGEEALGYQKKLLNERIFSYYKNIGKNTLSLIDILVAENLSRSLENFFYQKSLVDEDKNIIVKIVFYIKDLEEKKVSLEQNQQQLSALKIEVDKQSQVIAGEIATISQKIAELSARQQQLIAQKLASLNIPRSAATSLSGCVDDRGTDPGFSPRLAFFTYGVPNRVGLNQYGAWGRAKAGQGVEQILQEYYPGYTLKKDYSTGETINVDGYGSYNVEDYVKRIYEMPDSWTDNDSAALKAQAVAARSYGLAHKGGICPTDHCQVFKPDPKGGNWENAVNATSGWVLVDGGGNPVSSQYSSTHGGYILNLNKFDGTGSSNNFNDINNNAYDKMSPWFYCDWGSRAEFSKTAWLKTNEVADIVNAIQLAKRDSSIQEHLYQPDRPNPAGTDTWDAEKVKSELRARGGSPYSSVSDVSVGVDFGAGRVNTVSVSGDAGNTSFDGGEFKNFFNLRAPANVQIVGPLFAVEKR